MKRGLCEICNPKQWKTISSDMLKSEGYPVYGANGVIGYFSEYNHKKATLLITCRGATCGALNICEPFSYVNGNAMALDDLSPEVDLKYLYYYLLTRGLSDTITGSAQPQIVRHSLQKVEVFYPQLDEQRRIAAVLDKVSDLIAKRREQLDKLDELVKARFVEMFGDPVSNPHQYPISQLSEYIEFLTSGSRGWSQYFSDDGEYFITIKNVKNCSISLEDVQYIKPPDNAEAVRTKVKDGDLLISITADLGRTGVVTKEIADHGAYINQHLTCIRLNREKLNPLYVAYYMESSAGKMQFNAKNQAGVKAGLNFNAINSLKLVVPPLEKQGLFVEFVSQTNKSKLTIQQSLDKLEVLKKALMQQYFG